MANLEIERKYVIEKPSLEKMRECEAYTASDIVQIYLDAEAEGFKRACEFLKPIMEKQLSGRIVLRHLDAKTELQQLIQQAEGDFLEYVVVGEKGPDHQKEFEVVAKLNSNVIGRGKGRSKREAEQNAAKEALALFGEI